MTEQIEDFALQLLEFARRVRDIIDAYEAERITSVDACDDIFRLLATGGENVGKFSDFIERADVAAASDVQPEGGEK